MAGKQRGMQAHEQHRHLISKAISILERGDVVSDDDLEVYRTQMITIINTIKKDRGFDVITLNRGRQTIGWILASEVLKK